MALTFFDYTVLSIIIFFVFIGIMRGFIKELASLVNLIGSGILTVLLRPMVNNLVSSKISNPIASNITSSILVFILAIIGLSIVTSSIARAINARFPASINVTLGLAFGFMKGFLISSLIFATILNVFGDTDDLSTKSGPDWLQGSQTYRPLSFGAYIILPFVDSVLGQIKEKYSPVAEENINNDDQIKKSDNGESGSMDRLIDKVNKKDEDKKGEGGYRKDQLKKLDHLIDIL